MPKDKRSFFERLTGTVSLDDYDDNFYDGKEDGQDKENTTKVENAAHYKKEYDSPEEDVEGQLAVDVYQSLDAIVIKALVAGVKPDDLDVSITRDMVTIKGKRNPGETVTDENYFYQELYWGAFSRAVVLPQEIEVEGATAIEKFGLLTITLPKIDKAKQSKLKVRSN